MRKEKLGKESNVQSKTRTWKTSKQYRIGGRSNQGKKVISKAAHEKGEIRVEKL